ncbi:MAG: hypothetical protein LBU45_00090 [Azoarcus sp.]|jgi:hypothetical protein|nr:hypothetical protein [Azoarcus sp.]
MKKNVFVLVLAMALAWSFMATGAGKGGDPFYSKSLEKTFTATYDSAKNKISFKHPKEMEVDDSTLICFNPHFRITLIGTTGTYSGDRGQRGTLDDARRTLEREGYTVTDATIDGLSAVRGIMTTGYGAGGQYIAYSDKFRPSRFYTIQWSVMEGHVEEYAPVMDKIVAGMKFK